MHILLKLLTSLTLFCIISSSTIYLKAQNALDFDGTDDRVAAPNASTLISGSSFSMACWVYPTNPAAGWPNFDGFIGFRNESNADFYLLQLSSTNVEARLRNSTGAAYSITSSTLVLNTWNHYALTYDGSRLRLYHNGVLTDSTNASGSILNTTSTFFAGTIPFGATNFDLDGRLDDVGLWNRVLTGADVNTIYNSCYLSPSDPGLQLCYLFNQGNGGGNNSGITQVTDSKGNINGTMTGFALNGNTSNFVTYGFPQVTTLSDTALCSYSSPSGNAQWTSTGTYSDTLTNVAGCDSIIIVNLFIDQGPRSDTLYPNVCDPYVSPSGNYTWTTSGTYSDTLVSSSGCDSLLTIFLTANQPSAASLSDTACQSYTSPSGNHVWTTSGTYMDTLPNMAGCDSVLTIQLSITSLDTSVTVTTSSLTSNATGVTYQWLLCDNNFQAIPSATNASFTPGGNGNYAVAVTANGCTDTSSCINFSLVSLAEGVPDFEVTVFPNPNSGQFHIKFPAPVREVTAILYDVTGREIARQQFSDTDGFPMEIHDVPGVYFAELRIGSQVRRMKVIKSRN